MDNKLFKRPKKIILVANSSWYFYNFRLQLLKDIREIGYEIYLIAPKDKYTVKLIDNKFKFIEWNLKRLSINPINELISLMALIRIYLNLKPDLSHHFTIKSCIYGTIAAKISNTIFVINAITGLGYVFLSKNKSASFLRFFLRPLYRLIFKARRSIVIFQNSKDLEELNKLGITSTKNSNLISSSGVDINYFYPLKKNYSNIKKLSKFLFPSRVIREKGFFELIEACIILWDKGLNFELQIAGDIDKKIYKILKKEYSRELKNNNRLIFHGEVNNIRDLYSKCDIVILPSWREGLSKSLIEAASMEIPIITTDVPGCTDVIDHGINGLIVPPKDSDSIALAMELLIHNPLFAEKLGKAARIKVIDNFEMNLINNTTIYQYKRLLN